MSIGNGRKYANCLNRRPAADGHGEGMDEMGVFFLNFATALK